VKNFPFKEEKLSKTTVIREFKENLLSDDLEWHQDDEDRFVISLVESDWKIQMDNKIPQSLNEGVFIKRHEWHRLIKGKGGLKVKITKF
jgi:hypothetical protein